MKKYGLIGFPLENSFSKAFFDDFFYTEGIHASYELFPLNKIEFINKIIGENPDLNGLNVTMPYKNKVIPFLDEIDPIARDVQAINTIKITRKGEKIVLRGYNTDVIGFKRSFMEFIGDKKGKCLILGTGGAARAVKYVLNELNMPYKIVTRKETLPGKINYKQLNKKYLQEYPILINTTPLGMVPAMNDYPDIPYQHLTDGHFLFDLVYNPVETIFLRKGKEKGCKVTNGMNMLIYQAQESWKIWQSH